MAPLPFNLGLVQLLADHRNILLTKLAHFAGFAGGVKGYILLAALIYVVWNKRLAVQLSVVMLAALSINDLLKLLIRNPRPFIAQGTYLQKWAVSARNASDLATEFSTPSGHAAGAGAFYAYLYGKVQNRVVRIVSVAAILLIGVSRAYLGVHYFEDVFLGWALGLAVAAAALHYAEAYAIAWNRLSYWFQIAIVAPAGLALWLIAVLLNGHSMTGPPYAYLCYGGFLTGIVVARPLELSKVNFDPRSSTIPVKILRYLLSVGLLILTFFAVEPIFLLVAYRDSLLWYLLEYLRFIAAGFVLVFLAPWVFTRIGWARTLKDGTSSFAD
ncbi:MAG: phosphatase PAP2 family protein [Terracidiphilus sp.]